MPGDRLTRFVRAVQAVDAHEEAGERLARAGGRGDQRVGARRDVRPAVALRRRRPLGEAPTEPLADRRMEAVDRRATPQGELVRTRHNGGHEVPMLTNRRSEPQGRRERAIESRHAGAPREGARTPPPPAPRRLPAASSRHRVPVRGRQEVRRRSRRPVRRADHLLRLPVAVPAPARAGDDRSRSSSTTTRRCAPTSSTRRSPTSR